MPHNSSELVAVFELNISEDHINFGKVSYEVNRNMLKSCKFAGLGMSRRVIYPSKGHSEYQYSEQENYRV